MEIDAENLSFGPYEVESAHSVIIFTGSPASLKKQESSHFYLTPRLKTGISQLLSKRGNPFKDIKESLGGDDGPLKEVKDELKGEKEGLLEDVKELPKEGMENILEGLEDITNFNKSISIDFDKNLNETTHNGKDMTYSSKEDRKPILSSTGHGQIWPNITLVDSHAKVHLEVSAVVGFNISGAAGLVDKGLGLERSSKEVFEESLTDFYIQMETVEDMDVRFQMEFEGTVGVAGHCKLFLFPTGSFACTAGPMINNDLFSYSVEGIPAGNDIKHHSENSFGVSILPHLPTNTG
jgi:hypothetical protein